MAFTDRLHNRGSISTGYDIENSIKTQANAGNEWFYRSSPTTGNKRTFTFSFWIKRTQLTGFEADPYLMSQGSNARFHFAGDTLRFMFDGGTTELEASGVLRDTSAWYHIVLAVDTTQATAANRVKAYLNGQDYDWNNTKYPSQNQEGSWMSGTNMYFNTRDGDGAYDNSGYWSEVVVVDGQQLDPTSFGEFDEDNGIWKPIDVSSLTFGSEGFYYKFDNASSLGEDSSGNGNDATLNNITSADQATDTPTNNFSTFNVLHPYSSASNHNPTFTEGATRFTTLLPGYWEAAVASMGITSGKWYFEAQPGTSTSHITSIGYGDESDIHDWGQDTADTNGFPGEGGTNSIGYLGSDTSSSYGNIWLGTGSTSNVNANYTISNIVGVAIDADNGYVYFARDNTYVNSGNPGSGASGTGGYTFQDVTTPRTGTVFPAVAGYYHTAATVININFGGYTTISISSAETDENGYGTFEYAPPSGYYALCTKNLAEYG